MSDNTPQNPPAPTVEAGAPRQIADGVFVIEDRRVPLVPNIGIVLGNDKALVIDTGMGRKNGERVLAAARALAGSRQLVLTLTHFHPEHGYGADAFKGNAEILYNNAQAEELADKGEAYLEMFKGMGQPIADALAGTKLVAAETIYDGAEHVLDLGGRKVLLKTWGRAHTRGDQIVYLPNERVLFTGDLAEEKTFPIFPWFPPHDMDIDGDNWVAALNDCLALEPLSVVPGHGDIGGVEILTGVRDYIVDVATKVKAARVDQEAVESIVARLAAQIRSQHPDWHFPEWINFAIRYRLAQPT